MLVGLSGRTKAVFFRQLATMVNSGLPVGRAVATASQSGLPRLGKEISSLVDNGSRLSEAMARYPFHFSKYEIALVRAGETSGQLDRQLNELATSSESNWQMSKKISSKLLYPVIVAHSVVLLPPLFLLVKDGLQAYLKATLGILIPAYLIIGTLIVVYRMFRHQGGPRRLMDNVLSHLPWLSAPVRSGARIRFLSTLSSLIEAGFLPSQAVPLAADSCDNYWLRDRILRAYEKVGKEAPVSQIMQLSGSFESFELGLVVSGEESGSFASSIKRAADNLRPEYEAQIHRLMTILPLMLLFVVGGMVAVVAVKTMTGIFAPIADIL